MKKLTKILAAAVLLAPLLAGAGVALAATPVLSVTQSGNFITLSISGASTYSPVYLFQRQSASTFTESASLGNTDGNGNFTNTQTVTFDGSSNPVYLYIMVNGLSSAQVQIPPGSCASGCASGSLSLSQTSVSLNSGGTSTVTAYPTSGTISVTASSNSSAASYFVSGNSIIITAINTGSTTLTVCATGSSQCGSILVSVNNGSSTTLNFSTSNPILSQGQSQTVTIYSPSNNSGSYYISSNSNSNLVTASVTGSTLFLYGSAAGSDSISICQTGTSYCGILTVTVGSGSGGLAGLSLSQNTLSITTGQTGTLTVSNANGSLTVGNNSNQAVASVSVTNQSNSTSQTITVYGIEAGQSSVSICQASPYACVSFAVIVGSNSTNSSGNGSISFSVPDPVMTIGQSQSIAIYSSNAATTYTISNNSSANIVSLSLSGSSLYLVGQNTGTSNISICESGTNICGTLDVTVNGSNGGLIFNPTSVTVAQNQSSTVAISGGSGTYYISSNTNPSAAAVSLQSTNLYITGLNSGSASVTVCDSSNSSVCSTVLVSVGTSTTGTSLLSFSNSAPVLAVGQSQGISVSGGSSGTYYISSISSSSVVSLNLTGSLLNITALSLGNSTVTVCQTGASACASLNITVNSTGSSTANSGSVSFTTTSLTAATLNQSYSFQLGAQGGLGSYNYSVTSGTLPAGLTMTSGGLIDGTPTVEGSYSFTLEVVDSGGTNQSLNFTLAVNPASSLTIPTAGSLPAPAVSGTPTYNNGELINENGTISIVYQNTKTPFANAPAFLGLDFSFGNVQTVSNSGLPLSGKIVVTADGAHPRGSWLLRGSTVYFISPNGLIPVPSWAIFLNNGGQASYIVPANSYDLAFPMLPLMTLNDARLQ